ncbi:hypothetical protein BJ912DRAFT_983102, partial [Pholiota molesta]
MPHKELAEHVKFWLTLKDKIVYAVIQQELHVIMGGHDGIISTEGDEREVLSDLSKYCEVDRLNMESYHPEDATVVQEQADQLILWTQSARKQLVEVRMNTRALYKEQEQKEESARAMSIILNAVEEMKEQREMQFFSFENHIRAMLSLVSSLHHQMSATPHTITSKKPQSTSHAELGPSSAQIESHITRISNGLTGLASARNLYEIRLSQLQKQIEDEASEAPPLLIRPISITPEDIRNATSSIVEADPQLDIRVMYNDLLEDIEHSYEELARKLHDGFEIPFRTIQLKIKQYKIKPTAIFENPNFRQS